MHRLWYATGIVAITLVMYQQSLAIRRTSAVIYNLIQIYGLEGNTADAKRLYDEYITMRPQDAEAHIFLRKFTQ